MAAPSIYKKEFNQIALDLMRDGASIVEVCAEIGINRDTLYDWINPESERFNQEFSDTIKNGKQLCQAWWEKKGREATFNDQGFNATSYIFNMKNRFKDDWKDKHEVDQKTETTIIDPKDFMRKLLE
jgi:transposase